MDDLSEPYLRDAYEVRLLSTYQIAKEKNTYPNRVRRALKKYGILLRDKSDAQSVALQSGRHKHPTKGKERSESIKIKISESMAKVWDKMGDTERQRRIELAKKQWQEMSIEEQKDFKRLATEAVRVTASEGSKLERYILTELKVRGYVVQFHPENLLSQEKMQIDLLLPQLKIAIEIDGPSHFYPIWGEENLAKKLLSDNMKTGLLIQAGYAVFRVKYLAKTLSKIQERKILAHIVSLIEEVSAKFEPKLIEIEMR